MSFYSRVAYRLFSQHAERISDYFIDLRSDLKRAHLRISIEEFLSKALLTAFIVFLFELPIFSFIFGIIFKTFLFSFITAFTVSSILSVLFFYLYLNYPKAIIRARGKEIDKILPFATLYLSTLSHSRLPLAKVFKIFTKFSGYKAIVSEIEKINADIELFGLDVNTALERATERSPSKNLRELLWGMLSTIRSGGDLGSYLKQKSSTLMMEYRRKLHSFARSLTVYIEVYLTAVILGTIFFIILTAVIAGVSAQTENVLILQFILIFIFLPAISLIFILFIKAITPGGE